MTSRHITTRRAVPALCLFLVLALCRAAAAEIDAAGIMEKSAESIVAIYTVDGSQYEGQGSGIIASPTGVILTNFHVIQGASAISVKLKNGDIYDDVAIVDYNERLDLAVIKIKAIRLKPALMGDSNTLRVGEEVVAIGNPLGLEHTISKGIISQIRDSGKGYKVIQSDATITFGSSGGALFNTKGEVIGITSAVMSDSAGENLNFSLPINYAIPYVSETPKMTVAEFFALTGAEPGQPGADDALADQDSTTLFEFGSRFCESIHADMSTMLDFMGWRFLSWVAVLQEMDQQTIDGLVASGISMDDIVNQAAGEARDEVAKDIDWTQFGDVGTCSTVEGQIFSCEDVYSMAGYYGMMGEKMGDAQAFQYVGETRMGTSSCGAIIIRDNLGEELAMGLVLTEEDWKIISMWEPEE